MLHLCANLQFFVTTQKFYVEERNHVNKAEVGLTITDILIITMKGVVKYLQNNAVRIWSLEGVKFGK